MLGLILRSLGYYWRTHLGVLAGVALASAVLTGALLVGDSVDYSLRTFAAMRLQEVEFALDTKNQYIDQSLAVELGERLNTDVAATLHLRGMAIYQGDTAADRKQINRVEVLGVDSGFWALSAAAPIELAPNETALGEKLATALGLAAGDEISLRVEKSSLMARDAPLSWRGDDQSRRAIFQVKAVLPDTAMGRFSLAASQVAPYNAFVNRTWLQNQVDMSQRVNRVLIGANVTADQVNDALHDAWKPEHLGLHFRAHESSLVQLESDRVFLDAETTRASLAISDAEGTLTYLVNALAKGDNATPYSFVVAGPVPQGMRDDEIVINRWLADEIDAQAGDRVAITYAELLPTNEFVDRRREFTIHSVREMTDLETERDLMPTFPGLSDVESCADWDVGTPMDEELLNDEANEVYWETYHQTPKALVTLAAGQDMWANRFGGLTAVRYRGGTNRAAELRERLRTEINPTLAGLFFQPVGEYAQAAVSQAMPFGLLFLGMSFFLIVAALMLTGLLFVFGVQQRASEMGTLLALGFQRATIRRLILGEGLFIALSGSVLGAALSTLYARALIFGLAQYWQGAVANAAIRYHATTLTLIVGASVTLLCAIAAMAIAMWRQSKHSARELLTLDFTQDQPTRSRPRARRAGVTLSTVGVMASIVIVIYVQFAELSNVAAPFFAVGSLLLLSGLGFFRHALIRLNTGGTSKQFTLRSLALQNLARRQGRSLTVVGLLACGCFIVFAASSMQEDLTANAHQRSSGTGGFALLAEATFPLLEDPLADIDAPDISATAIKVRDGDDASCLNLNRAQTPRLLGVNVEDLRSRGAFTKDGGAIWELLSLELEDGAIPALVGDSNTAMYNLQKKTGVKRGDVLLYNDESGKETKVKLVGRLPMRLSVFQGAILMSDASFTRMYPSESGHRMFLIDAPADGGHELAASLAAQFDRFGLDAIPAVQRILEFYAVETTYLAMFLVLGGLGLAIGSAGMGVVVLRNLFERRREIAMLHAIGFADKPIYRILYTEYGFLLLAGLGIGGIAAAVSMLPALLAAQSETALGVQLSLAILVVLASVACTTAAIITGFHKHDPAALRNE